MVSRGGRGGGGGRVRSSHLRQHLRSALHILAELLHVALQLCATILEPRDYLCRDNSRMSTFVSTFIAMSVSFSAVLVPVHLTVPTPRRSRPCPLATDTSGREIASPARRSGGW